jgi:hypothetical protein
MKEPEFLDWLFQNGGPVIRYLAAVEHKESPTPNMFNLQQELLKSKQVQYWMACLTGRTGLNELHGSRDTCFENAMGKLILYGLRSGVAEFDRRCASYLLWLKRSMEENRKDVMFVFHQTIVASLLAGGGFLSVQSVLDYVLSRLRTVSDFAEANDFSIYVGKSRFKGIPVAYRDYPLVNPDLYEAGNFSLPWIHDVYAFAALNEYLCDNEVARHVERVISYILDPRYQQYHDGYGIVLIGKKRYNIMGWNVWLPCFDGLHNDSFNKRCLVHRLGLMSHFKTARSSRWFRGNLDMLSDFENQSGRYVLPKAYLQEKKNSYFVNAGHMGLDDNRRRRLALEIESSLWMMKIMHNMQEEDKRE